MRTDIIDNKDGTGYYVSEKGKLWILEKVSCQDRRVSCVVHKTPQPYWIAPIPYEADDNTLEHLHLTINRTYGDFWVGRHVSGGSSSLLPTDNFFLDQLIDDLEERLYHLRDFARAYYRAYGVELNPDRLIPKGDNVGNRTN